MMNGIGKRPKRTFQYLAAITSCLNTITSGLHFGWTSPSLSLLLEKDSPIPITNAEGSWIAVAILVGAICGSALAGMTLDRLGRKNVILLTAIPFFISWIMLAYAESVLVILLARFMAGISDGLSFCSIPMYLAEIADPGIRGLLGSSVVVTFTGGTLLMNIIASYLTIKTTALISSSLSIFLLVTFVWMPESPYYLIMKGRSEEARKSLRLFRGTENVEEELRRISNAVEEQTVNSGKYLDLFTVDSNRKALLIVLGLRAFTELSGTTALTFYVQIVFKEISTDLSPVATSTIYFAVKLFASGLSSVIVDRTGRIPLAIISLIGSSVTLFIEGIYFYIKTETDINTSSFSFIPVVALIGSVIMINVGLQTVTVVVISELFPANVKVFAFSFNDIGFCLFSLIVSKFFQFTMDEFGMWVPFFVFAICCVIGLPFTILCVPETKGKTLEQIQDELKGKSGNPRLPEIELMLQKL